MFLGVLDTAYLYARIITTSTENFLFSILDASRLEFTKQQIDITRSLFNSTSRSTILDSFFFSSFHNIFLVVVVLKRTQISGVDRLRYRVHCVPVALDELHRTTGLL